MSNCRSNFQVEDSQPEVKAQPPIAGMHEDVHIDDLYTKYKVNDN